MALSSPIAPWGCPRTISCHLWSSGAITPFQWKQSLPLLQRSFLTSLPKENILILLWKSTLPTIPGLDFLEGRAGVRIDLLCKCISAAFLLQGTIAHFGRKQGTAPNRLKSYLLSLCAVQPWSNYLVSSSHSYLTFTRG